MSRRQQKRFIKQKFNAYIGNLNTKDDKLNALSEFEHNADISFVNGDINLYSYKNICDVIAELKFRVRSTL